MTPTLFGRWQTRFFLLMLIGVPITIVFTAFAPGVGPLIILFLVMVLGFGWDVFYQLIQRQRWDQDWPPVLQLMAGIVELLLILTLVFVIDILPGPTPNPIFFLAHYWTVWVATFLASQSLMRLVFPRWRFNGGQWLG